MTLEEYILTYRGTRLNGEEGIIANIPDYYDHYIKPLNSKFGDSSLNVSRTAICPLHDDTDPSMGLINHKFLKGVRLFHCFGCNMVGTVVRLHQLIVEKYEKRQIDVKQSCEELARFFKIPIDKELLAQADNVEPADRFYQTSIHIEDLKNDSYTSQDFVYELRDIKKSAKSMETVDLNLVNVSCIKMIATVKKLYN